MMHAGGRGPLGATPEPKRPEPRAGWLRWAASITQSYFS